jgi:hypothetical protein
VAAARGLRETDEGTEAIADPEELRRNRRLAWRILTYSLVTAVLATGLFASASLPAA